MEKNRPSCDQSCIEGALQREIHDENQPGDEARIEAASLGIYDSDDTGSSELFGCLVPDCKVRFLLHQYFNSHDQKRRFIQQM